MSSRKPNKRANQSKETPSSDSSTDGKHLAPDIDEVVAKFNIAPSATVKRGTGPLARSPVKRSKFGTISANTKNAALLTASPAQQKLNVVHVVGIDGGIMLALLRGKDLSAGYFPPLIQFCENPNNDRIAKDKCRINYTGWMADPNDISGHTYKEDPPRGRSQFRPRYSVLLSIMDDETKNTVENRAKWGEVICKLNNSDSMQQHKYGVPLGSPKHKLQFGGDLTPADGGLPKLSRFMVLQDVMDLICNLHTRMDEETGEPRPVTPPEILEDPALLAKFFMPSHIPNVRRQYNAETEAFTTGDGVENHIGTDVELEDNLAW